MNEERQEGESGGQQRGREVKHGASWEGRKMRLRKSIRSHAVGRLAQARRKHCHGSPLP